MRFLFALFTLFSLSFLTPFSSAQAQALKILAEDAIFGTGSGATLGLATMALKDDADLAPLRTFTGLGVFFGVGVGIYDVVQSDGNYDSYVQGAFNSTQASAKITFLDTFYGSAVGSLLGMAVTLVSGDELVDGLQTGFGIGAYAGFTFGLVDAFLIAPNGGFSGGDDGDYYSEYRIRSMNPASGQAGLSYSLLRPVMVSQPQLQGATLSQNRSIGIEIARMNFRF